MQTHRVKGLLRCALLGPCTLWVHGLFRCRPNRLAVETLAFFWGEQLTIKVFHVHFPWACAPKHERFRVQPLGPASHCRPKKRSHVFVIKERCVVIAMSGALWVPGVQRRSGPATPAARERTCCGASSARRHSAAAQLCTARAALLPRPAHAHQAVSVYQCGRSRGDPRPRSPPLLLTSSPSSYAVRHPRTLCNTTLF